MIPPHISSKTPRPETRPGIISTRLKLSLYTIPSVSFSLWVCLPLQIFFQTSIFSYSVPYCFALQSKRLYLHRVSVPFDPFLYNLDSVVLTVANIVRETKVSTKFPENFFTQNLNCFVSIDPIIICSRVFGRFSHLPLFTPRRLPKTRPHTPIQNTSNE